MSKNTSISLGPYFENFIREKLEAGDYKNTSEVIRAALRLLKERDEHITLLREALKKGEESGFVSDFSPEEFLASLKKERLNNE